MDINPTALIPFLVIVLLLTVFCLWHLFRTQPRFIPRWGWVLLILFTSPVGGAIYVLVEVLDAGTTRHDAEGRQTPPE